MKEILCTLGPASLNQKTISKLENLGVGLFRINLSHTQASDLEQLINKIRSYTKVPICLDTEGAQIRTGGILENEITVRDNAILHVYKNLIPGNSHSINFYPLDIIDQLQVGDFITIDFNAVLAQVVKCHEEHTDLRILSGGKIGKNKAITVRRQFKLSPFTEKDRQAIKIGKKMGIRHYALSFANYRSDVEKMREMIGEGSIISKIECENGLINLGEISGASDAILIDRGDLSREVEIERIPLVQKKIIEKAHESKTKVYVATNLLETMITTPLPTRAEVNDIYNTLIDGADGLVLAAETAIGKYPVKCAEMVVRLIHEYEQREHTDLTTCFKDQYSFLIEPHGGTLIQNNLPNDFCAEECKEIIVGETDLLDCEQLAIGTYSPLNGFMNKVEFDSVLNNFKTVDGIIWTMPIVLQVQENQAKKLSKGDRIILTGEKSKARFLLELDDIYRPDMEKSAEAWFGTTTKEHPGVRQFLEKGDYFLAGKVSVVEKSDSSFGQYAFTPVETRYVFHKKGWSKVVGFHTRNIVHRGHEFIQLKALEDCAADGLYISPVIGPKKDGDFLTPVILKSYQTLIDFGYYPFNKVLLGAFSTYSRYCGPREAVFTALCRKNMGCSHFILGRDHTGVGNFYERDANSELFDKLGDLGICPVFFDEYAYTSKNNTYESTVDSKDELWKISGTKIRELLTKDSGVPVWMLREVVSEMLRGEVKKGRELFHK